MWKLRNSKLGFSPNLSETLVFLPLNEVNIIYLYVLKSLWGPIFNTNMLYNP